MVCNDKIQLDIPLYTYCHDHQCTRAFFSLKVFKVFGRDLSCDGIFKKLKGPGYICCGAFGANKDLSKISGEKKLCEWNNFR